MTFLAARAEHLAVLRIVVFGIWLVLIATTDPSVYPMLPGGLSDPRGLGNALGLPVLLQSPVVVQALWVASLLGCTLCVLGVRPYGAFSAVTAVLVLYHDAAMKSFGSYANHAQMIPLLLVLMLPLFPAADAFSISPRRPRLPRGAWMYRTPLLTAAVIVCLTYSFIGARRLFVGGVGIYTDGSMLQWIVARTLEYGAHDVSVGLSLVDYTWLVPLLGVGLLVATVFEILSPLAIRYRRFRWGWLAVIAAFHVSTLLLMNIFFWENLILLALLFTPIGSWMGEWLSRTTPDERPSEAPTELPVSP